MASWALVDVPDSASEYVGDVLEASGKIAENNLELAAGRINEAADAATKVLVAKIAASAA